MDSYLKVSALGVLMLCACSKDVQWALPSETLKLSRFEHGRPVSECSVGVGSPQYQKLSAWLASHQEGWEPTLATYVPGVYITGSNFSINFLGPSVIVNYPEGQFARATLPAEYAFLSCAVAVQQGAQADALRAPLS